MRIETSNNRIDVHINLEQILNKFLIHLKDTTDSTTFIYNCIQDGVNDLKRPLPTDSLPLQIDDNKAPLSIEEQKERALNWLFRKAFEELIVGLTKSLIEAYRYLKVLDLASQDLQKWTKEKMEQKISNIDISANRAHFPDLIKHIEQCIDQPLYLRDEIISINRARNCMVHSGGIVQDKDLKDKGSNVLTLKWKIVRFSTEKNGQQILLEYRTRKDGIHIDNLQMELIDNFKEFSLGERISIDLNEFNDILYTCSIFTKTIFNTLK